MKKSEYEFKYSDKNIEKNDYGKKGIDDKDDFQKYLNSNIPLTLLNKEDFIEPTMEPFPLTSFGDYNNILYNCSEKEFEKNEIENENELTNQNSGIYYKIQKRKINKIKKIKFLVLPNHKKTLNSSKSKIKAKKRYIDINENLDKNKETQIKNKSKNLNEKILINMYKYKCEHPGCGKTFKTLKLKLNRHDISDNACKNDTISLIYMIKDVKNLIKKIKRKSKTRIGRLKKLYKKCIFILPHKEYVINIAGNNLIN